MPPRAKFSREEITEAAFSIVRAEGMQALTARSLGNALGSSARPIFTVFQNMEEVQSAVLAAARARYKEYVAQGLLQVPAFEGVGKQYIRFAAEEPKLFQLLFMAEQENIPSLSNILPQIDESYRLILASIEEGYGVTGEAAQRLYHHLWIYSHGIATLYATQMCRFTEEEIHTLLKEVFTGLLGKLQTAAKQKETDMLVARGNERTPKKYSERLL